MKVVDLVTAEELSEKSLAEAVKRVGAEIHDGWADLTVHQAQLRKALRLSTAHNSKTPGMQIRVMTSARLGHDDWNLKTISVEVRVERERK